MEQALKKTADSKILRTLLAVVLAIGVAIPVGLTFGSNTALATETSPDTTVQAKSVKNIISDTADTSVVDGNAEANWWTSAIQKFFPSFGTSIAASDLQDTGERIRTKATFVDANKYQEGMTIDDVMMDPINAANMFMFQQEYASTIYDFGNSDYYIALLDMPYETGVSTEHAQDADFARDNDYAQMIDGCIYDAESGIAFIPRSYVDSYEAVEGVDRANVMQAQILCSYLRPSLEAQDNTVTVPMTIKNTTTQEVVNGAVTAITYEPTTNIQLVSAENAAQVDPSSIVMKVNDEAASVSAVNSDEDATNSAAVYDNKTGILTTSLSALSVTNAEISFASYDEVGIAPQSTGVVIGQGENMNCTSYVFDELDLQAIIDKGLVDQWMVLQGYRDASGDYLVDREMGYGVGKHISDVDSSMTGTAEITGSAYTFTPFLWGGNMTDAQWKAGLRSCILDGSAQALQGLPVFTGMGGNTDLEALSWHLKEQPSSVPLFKADCAAIDTPVPGTFGPDALWVNMICKVTGVDTVNDTVTLCFIPTPINPAVTTQTCYSILKFKVESKGNAELTKQSSRTDITDGNTCYSLAGAQYGVYSDAACSTLVTTMTTDEKGYALSEDMKKGNYWVKETTASAGYAVDDTVYPIEVKSNDTTPVNGGIVYEEPQNDPAEIWIVKHDKETDEESPLNGAALEGAEFTINYYGGQYDTPEAAEAAVAADGIQHRTWVVKTAEDGYANITEQFKVSGDDFYTYRNEPIIPLGTLFIQETKAPEGYLLGDDGTAPLYTRHVTAEGSVVPVATYDYPTTTDQVMRGNMQFKKHDEESNASMANIPFILISLDKDGNEVESHVVVTDPNGQFNTNTFAHSMNTNGNDAAVTKNADGTYTVDESKLDFKAGVWFGADGESNKATIDDTKNSLPYGQYKLVELSVAANEGMNLVNVPVNMYANNLEVDLGTIDDRTIYIGTTATDGADGDKVIPADEAAVIKDTIEYTNLSKGENYTMKGTLVDPETGKALLDANGKEITAEKSFTATKANGFVDVEFTFDALELSGKKVVVFEECVNATGTIVAEHKDPNDTFQTVEVEPPTIGTTATDGVDGDKIVSADPNDTVTVVDTVKYSGLVVGKEYVCEGTLMDKLSNKPFLDANGKEIIATTTFTPEQSDGTVDVTFEFNASVTESTEVVAFETLLRNKKPVAVHTDINDKPQTVTIVPPSIGTTLTDSTDGDHEAISGQAIKLIDTVQYSGLVVGKEYVCKGTLMDKATGKELLIDNKTVTSEATFTPEQSDGTVDIEFIFDATKLENKTVVAFEYLYQDKTEVAVHTDINDNEQTVKLVEVPNPPTPNTPSTPSTPSKGFYDKTGMDNMLRLMCAVFGLTLGGVCAAAYGIRRRHAANNNITN